MAILRLFIVRRLSMVLLLGTLFTLLTGASCRGQSAAAATTSTVLGLQVMH